MSLVMLVITLYVSFTVVCLALIWWSTMGATWWESVEDRRKWRLTLKQIRSLPETPEPMRANAP